MNFVNLAGPAHYANTSPIVFVSLPILFIGLCYLKFCLTVFHGYFFTFDTLQSFRGECQYKSYARLSQWHFIQTHPTDELLIHPNFFPRSSFGKTMRTFLFVAVVGLVLAVILESVNVTGTPAGSPTKGKKTANAGTNPENSPIEENEMLWDKACVLTRLVASSDIWNSGDLKIVDKDQTGLMEDLQTEADRSAQMMIERSLREKFGENLTIVGEEEITSPSTPFELLQSLPPSHHLHIFFKDNDAIEAVPSLEVLRSDKKVPDELRQIELQDFVVWIDPLDGTSEFTKSKDNRALLRQVTVLIGITYNGRPVAGVVHQPFYDGEQSRTVWSIVGVDTFGLQKPAQQIANTLSGKAIINLSDCAVPNVLISPPPFQLMDKCRRGSLSLPQVQNALDALVERKLISEVEHVGGAGFKGGTLSDMSGRQIRYDGSVQLANSGGLLATAPGVDHQSFVDAIPQHVKDALPEKEAVRS
ncbi:hypothetical protein niasHT_037219 [Heterodera trifolii]|uniref:3'(2'),5'-bisphosphate nucleotidase n=1 Tax=Heterodera trifolii TaxID=157864 RepID=A0ABD2I9L2_9BILA